MEYYRYNPIALEDYLYQTKPDGILGYNPIVLEDYIYQTKPKWNTRV